MHDGMADSWNLENSESTLKLMFYQIHVLEYVTMTNICKTPVLTRTRASSHVTDFNNRNEFLTAKLLKQGYWYHKFRKAFSKFYHRHFELIEKYRVSLKKNMPQGICNPEFYRDLVYKFNKIIGNPNFSNLFKRIVNRFKRAGYSLNFMRQTACLVLTKSWSN